MAVRKATNKSEAHFRTACVPFQLECGKKYGINFRIIAPNIMHTKLYEDFVQTLPADLSNIELFNTAPEEDTQPIGYVSVGSFMQ